MAARVYREPTDDYIFREGNVREKRSIKTQGVHADSLHFYVRRAKFRTHDLLRSRTNVRDQGFCEIKRLHIV